MSEFSKNTRRRQVLKWAAFALAGLAPKLGLAADFNRRRTRSLRDALFAVFKDQEAARAVGEQYLKEHPEDRDTVRLAAELFGSRPRRLSPQQVRRVLNRCRVDDFTNDRCALVSNWVLARSEARACALVALL